MLNDISKELVFESHKKWNDGRPDTLVITCSDGRLQQNIDDFLKNHLGIADYDRIYVPGGPGALSISGGDYLRSDLFRRECAFLLNAHGTSQVILIFHGATEDGPDCATCADYRRKMPDHPAHEITAQQAFDALEILSHGFGWRLKLQVHIYRAEVTPEGWVRFVEFHPRQASSV